MEGKKKLHRMIIIDIYSQLEKFQQQSKSNQGEATFGEGINSALLAWSITIKVLTFPKRGRSKRK